jgi:hypothetical protein
VDIRPGGPLDHEIDLAAEFVIHLRPLRDDGAMERATLDAVIVLGASLVLCAGCTELAGIEEGVLVQADGSRDGAPAADTSPPSDSPVTPESAPHEASATESGGEDADAAECVPGTMRCKLGTAEAAGAGAAPRQRVGCQPEGIETHGAVGMLQAEVNAKLAISVPPAAHPGPGYWDSCAVAVQLCEPEQLHEHE